MATLSSQFPGNAEFTPEFFEESSRAWMENKVRVGAQILYRCEYIHSNQKRCKKAAVSCITTDFHYCKQHKRMGKIRELEQLKRAEKKGPEAVQRVYELRSRNILIGQPEPTN